MNGELVDLAKWSAHANGRSGAQDEDLPRSRAPSEDRLRVVLGDADVLSRHGLAMLLESRGMSVLGQAAEPWTLLELVRAHRPGLVVVHQNLRGEDAVGLDVALAIRQEHPAAGIVVLATQVEVAPAVALLATGTGIGYLIEDQVFDLEDFAATLRRVARGGSVVDPALVQEMVAADRRRDPLEVLSPRELDVLGEMAKGRSNHGIAEALWVAPATIEKHIHSIMAKLDLPDGLADHRRVLAVLIFLNRTPDPV